MKKQKVKPSNFIYSRPIASQHHKAEYESEAMYVMQVLASYGNAWRKLTWEEYLEYYGWKAKNVSAKKKAMFDAVIPYTISPEAAASYSKTWAKIVKWEYCSWELAFHWNENWKLHYFRAWSNKIPAYTLVRHTGAVPITLDSRDCNIQSLTKVAELECTYKKIDKEGLTFIFESKKKRKKDMLRAIAVSFIVSIIIVTILAILILKNARW